MDKTNDFMITRKKFLTISLGTSIGFITPYFLNNSQKSEANPLAGCTIVVIGIYAIYEIVKANKQVGTGFAIKLKNESNKLEKVYIQFIIHNGNRRIREYEKELKIEANIQEYCYSWRWKGNGFNDSLYLAVYIKRRCDKQYNLVSNEKITDLEYLPENLC